MSVYFRGEELDNQGELKRATGLASLPIISMYALHTKRDEDCLCPVDVLEVAKQIGVSCENDGLHYRFKEIDK